MAAHNRARTGAKLGFAALLACLTVPALAQTIPLPTPRPPVLQTQGRAPPSSAPAAKPAGPSQALGARAQAPQPAPSHNPISNPFAALLGKANGAGKLTPEQRAIVERVNSYLSGVQMLTGNFVQVGPDGSRTQGDFYIYKPGRVRFEYDDPSPIELIADGSSVVVRDRRLATQDVYPLSQTPLRFLLAERVDLTKDTNLVSVYADDVFVTVVLEEKNGVVGTSRLMIMVFVLDKAARVDPLASFVSVPRAIKRRANDRRFEQKRALQRPRGRSPLAKSLGRARHLLHKERRPQAEILRAGDVPLPLGAHPYGA